MLSSLFLFYFPNPLFPKISLFKLKPLEKQKLPPKTTKINHKLTNLIYQDKLVIPTAVEGSGLRNYVCTRLKRRESNEYKLSKSSPQYATCPEFNRRIPNTQYEPQFVVIFPFVLMTFALLNYALFFTFSLLSRPIFVKCKTLGRSLT